MLETAELENNPTRAYLQRAMLATRLDATKLAKRARLSPSTLTRFLATDSPRKTLHRSTLDAIARFSKLPLPPELTASPAETIQPVEAGTRGVPIHALIAAPAEGLFYWNQTAIDFAPRPLAILHAERVFAIRAPDDSMSGWRRPGELVYIDPMRAVSEGDHALVEIANRLAPNNPSLYFVRRFVRRRRDEVTFATWGLDPHEAIFQRGDVMAMLRVLEWSELLGA